MALSVAQGEYTIVKGLKQTFSPYVRIEPIINLDSSVLIVNISTYHSKEHYEANGKTIDFAELGSQIQIQLLAEDGTDLYPTTKNSLYGSILKDFIRYAHDVLIAYINSQRIYSGIDSENNAVFVDHALKNKLTIVDLLDS